MSLYGWYSWPSIFLGFIGGYLLDNIFGLRFGTALACLFVVIGQVFLSIGKASEIMHRTFFGPFEILSSAKQSGDSGQNVLEASKGSFLGIIELCYFGRFIFGCGGETLSVAQKGFIAQWFDQKSLNFVLGLQLSFARIGKFIFQPARFIDGNPKMTVKGCERDSSGNANFIFRFQMGHFVV